MRKENKAVLYKFKSVSRLIKKINAIESFLNDFSFLAAGRDCIVCKNYVFSLQKILNSSQATLRNMIESCKCFCLADAYILLRKYRDDLFFCLYIVLYDVNIKSGTTKNTNRMETNIEQWCKNCLSNLHISEVLATIGSSDCLKETVRKYGLQKSFNQIGVHLNNYTHGNGYLFYNSHACFLDEKDIERQLLNIVSTTQYITMTFLFLLVLCAPQYIMSSDYIDHLDLGQVPPENSQFWVAPFVEEFFKKNLAIIDTNCYEFLKECTCMKL